MGDTYLQPKFDKDTLLKPKALHVEAATPLILVSDGSNWKAYTCADECFRTYDSYYNRYGDSGRRFYAVEADVICPDCSSVMSKEVTHVPSTVSSVSQEGSSTGKGGYVKSVVLYDDRGPSSEAFVHIKHNQCA